MASTASSAQPSARHAATYRANGARARRARQVSSLSERVDLPRGANTEPQNARMPSPRVAERAPRNDRGERMRPSVRTAQNARTRSVNPARDGKEKKEDVVEGRGANTSFQNRVEALIRSRLDQFFVSSFMAIPAGTLASISLLNARVIASAPGVRKSKFGAFRFTAKGFFDMLPNAKKKRIFTFTPWTGLMAAGLFDTAILVGVIINFIVTFFPYIVATLGVAILLDPEIREMMLSLVGF